MGSRGSSDVTAFNGDLSKWGAIGLAGRLESISFAWRREHQRFDLGVSGDISLAWLRGIQQFGLAP